MHRRSVELSRWIPSIALVYALAGCTEDPTLDRVGGSGPGTPDARPTCSDAVPDARPRSLPCDVEAVLRAKCQRCHNANDELDRCYPAKTCLRGPFPLLTWSDTHATFGDAPVFKLMESAVESDYMPFKTTAISPPVEPLDASQKATLLAWTRACAPPGGVACPSGDASP